MAAGLGLGAAFGVGASAQAATYEVDNTTDNGALNTCLAAAGDCSLRGAIATSNSTGEDDSIVFESGLTGTINAASSLTLTDTMTITGPGADALTVDFGTTTYGLVVTGTAETVPLNGPPVISELHDLTLSDGDTTLLLEQGALFRVEDTNISGGAGTAAFVSNSALYDSTILTLSDSNVTGNAYGIFTEAGSGLYVYGGTVSDNGGRGIYANGGSVTVTDATISGNDGGITALGGGLSVTDSSITGNTATGDGGGIRSTSYLDVERSTISDNTATATGGGILSVGPTTIGYSTVSGNSAPSGGGLRMFGEDAHISLSTFSGNTATSSGGGIQAEAAAVDLIQVTVSNNTAPAGMGGGLRGSGAGGATDIALENSVVANSTGGDLSFEAPVTFLAEFSLVEAPGTVSVTGDSNLVGVDPQLGDLANNGGMTRTHLPAASSLVVDCGRNLGAVLDQRELIRTVDQPGRTNSTAAGADGTDIGAVEVQAGAGSTGACANPPQTTPPPSGDGGTTLAPPSPPAKKKKKKCKKKPKKKCKKKK